MKGVPRQRQQAEGQRSGRKAGEELPAEEQWAGAKRQKDADNQDPAEFLFLLDAILAQGCIERAVGRSVARHERPRGEVGGDAPAESECCDHEGHAHNRRIELVAHRDAFADTGELGVATLLLGKADGAGCPHLVESAVLRHTFMVPRGASRRYR